MLIYSSWMGNLPQDFSLFDEIIILLTIAIAAGIVVMRFRQPPIIGFIAVGILAGPSGLSIIKINRPNPLVVGNGACTSPFHCWP